jgi:uncharacterized protein YciI
VGDRPRTRGARTARADQAARGSSTQAAAPGGVGFAQVTPTPQQLANRLGHDPSEQAAIDALYAKAESPMHSLNQSAQLDYFLVERAKGPAWEDSKPRREQAGWEAHAAFMDALAEDGFVVLGGPVGDGDGDNALLIIDAGSEAAVRARLAEDPWGEDMLTVESVRPWSVWLRAEKRP